MMETDTPFSRMGNGPSIDFRRPIQKKQPGALGEIQPNERKIK